MNRTKKILLSLVAFSFLFLPIASQAVDVTSQLGATAGTKGAGYEAARDPRLVVAYIIKFSLGILGILFLSYAIYAGFTIMTAAGDEEKVQEGKKTLQRAVIGIAIILSAYSITLLAQKIATGDAIHQGDYIEIKNRDAQFQNPDTLLDVPNETCPFGLVMQPNGDCGEYQNVP